MYLLANERSIHRQFNDLRTFRGAVCGLMEMRNVARRYGWNLFCHREFLNVEPVPGARMQQAVKTLTNNEQRALMVWLTRDGPFWDDARVHDPGERLECRDEIVTNSAIGEVAFRILQGDECSLVSAIPSNWDFSPVEVTWIREAEKHDDRSVNLNNWRNATALEEMLQRVAPPIQSWVDLDNIARVRFRRLTISVDCFAPLVGVPFAGGAADRFLDLLSILDRLAGAFDKDGRRTSEGNRIYDDHFTGKNALFSDSSDTEKRRFRTRLTFPHPSRPQKSLFCTWHGKVRHQTLRLHFSWPISADKPVYVMYAGPKLTKQ